MADRPSSSRRMTRVPYWNLSTSQEITRFIALVEQNPQLLVRITPQRLLPEWEKLVPITGVTAVTMAAKWKRLCDRYRIELRLEMASAPGTFKSNWLHFDQMAFARSVEEKRIRTYKTVQKNKPPPRTVCIKVEPGTQPPRTQQQPRNFNICSSTKPNTTPAGTYTKSMMLANTTGQPHGQTKQMIPIEMVMGADDQPRLGFTEQEILQDVQQQAARVVASRIQPVPRIPVPNLSATGFRDAPDNDFDFLMLRIYPVLSAVPFDAKRECYEKLQHTVVDLYKRVNRRR